MAHELTLLASGALDRDIRRSSRAISRIEGVGLVEQCAIDVETDLALRKIEAQTTALGAGMGAIGRVAQAVTAIEQLSPQASGRLSMLADFHGMAVADELDRLHQKLRRLG